MEYTIRETNGVFVIITPAGNVARNTSGAPFQTTDYGWAMESVEYLNQPSSPLGKREGSHRVKSTWGVV